MYYACALNKAAPNKKIVQRIGEQKQTMSTIIEILVENNEKGVNNQLIKELQNLKVSFDLIKIDYKFVQPKTDEARKLTTLQHTSSVIVDAKVIEELATKVISIRESIIN
jgi:DNA primase catalytic subunit